MEDITPQHVLLETWFAAQLQLISLTHQRASSQVCDAYQCACIVYSVRVYKYECAFCVHTSLIRMEDMPSTGPVISACKRVYMCMYASECFRIGLPLSLSSYLLHIVVLCVSGCVFVVVVFLFFLDQHSNFLYAFVYLLFSFYFSYGRVFPGRWWR